MSCTLFWKNIKNGFVLSQGSDPHFSATFDPDQIRIPNDPEYRFWLKKIYYRQRKCIEVALNMQQSERKKCIVFRYRNLICIPDDWSGHSRVCAPEPSLPNMLQGLQIQKFPVQPPIPLPQVIVPIQYAR